METIPEIAADPGNARQAAGKITESDRLDEIVKSTEYGRNLRESGLFARDGDHKKDRRQRQRSVDALGVDRHSVPTLPRHPESSAFSPNLFQMTTNRHHRCGNRANIIKARYRYHKRARNTAGVYTERTAGEPG